MERSYPVDRDVRPTAQPAAASSNSPSADSWSSPENQPALHDLMQDLLGAQAEPDPLFFVETWTLGVEAAAENFHARQPIASTHEPASSFDRPFDFTVPLVFIYDQSDFPSTPAGFSAAWKDAYGVAPSPSAHTKTPHNDAEPQAAPAPNQPLSVDDACRMLGVTPSSTRKQIKTAYRQLVLRYHPDRFIQAGEQERRIATDRMISLNEAYRLLCGSTNSGI